MLEPEPQGGIEFFNDGNRELAMLQRKLAHLTVTVSYELREGAFDIDELAPTDADQSTDSGSVAARCNASHCENPKETQMRSRILPKTRPFMTIACTTLVMLAITSLLLITQASAQTPTPPLSDLYFQLGQSHEEASQPAKASEFYLKALEADPTNTQALAALRQVLQGQAEDPRIAVADQYAATNQSDKAIELYLAILADNRARADIQEKAERAVSQSGSWWQEFSDSLTDVSRAIALGILVLIGLFALWLIARLVRLVRRGPPDNDLLRYVILPFRNATGVQSLSGVDEGVRAAITEWLYTNHAAVHDKAIVIEPINIPDIGGAAKIATWFSAQITPTPDATFVDGILLGLRSGSPKPEVGLTVYVREHNDGRICRTRTFWGSASSANDLNAYYELAYSAASWVFRPEGIVQPRSAVDLLQSNAHAVQSHLSSNRERKRREMEISIEFSRQAAAKEKSDVANQSVGSSFRDFGAGSTQRPTHNPIPSSLPDERTKIFESYLRDLEKTDQKQ